MKSLGKKDCFPLALFLQPLRINKLDYLPILTQGQKLVAGTKGAVGGSEYLCTCSSNEDVEILNDLWGSDEGCLFWYIMPELAYSATMIVQIQPDQIEIFEIVQFDVVE